MGNCNCPYAHFLNCRNMAWRKVDVYNLGIAAGHFFKHRSITNKRKRQFVTKYNLDKKIWYNLLSAVFTYFLFAFSEIFDGAVNSINDAFFVIEKICTNFNGPIYYSNPSMIFFLCIGIISLFFVGWKNEFYKGDFSFFSHKNWIVRA